MFTLPTCIIAVDVNTYIMTLINLINLLSEKNRSFVVKILFKTKLFIQKIANNSNSKYHLDQDV